MQNTPKVSGNFSGCQGSHLENSVFRCCWFFLLTSLEKLGPKCPRAFGLDFSRVYIWVWNPWGYLEPNFLRVFGAQARGLHRLGPKGPGPRPKARAQGPVPKARAQGSLVTCLRKSVRKNAKKHIFQKCFRIDWDRCKSTQNDLGRPNIHLKPNKSEKSENSGDP